MCIDEKIRLQYTDDKALLLSVRNMSSLEVSQFIVRSRLSMIKYIVVLAITVLDDLGTLTYIKIKNIKE